MKAEEVQKAVTATKTVPIKEKTKAIVPQVSQAKETKYCTLLQSTKITDKDGLGYTYAFEKIYVKELEREEVRICLYKDCLLYTSPEVSVHIQELYRAVNLLRKKRY